MLPLEFPGILQWQSGVALCGALVLATLQTGLATDELGGSAKFNYASSVFVVTGLFYLSLFGLALNWCAFCNIVGQVLYPTFDRPLATKADP